MATNGSYTAGSADERMPQGILVGLGSAAVIVAGFTAAMITPTHPFARYAVLVALVFAFAAVTGRWAAPAVVALVGFLVFDGFIVGRLGDLGWHGNADLARVLALAAAVIFGRLAGDSYRLYLVFKRAHDERRYAAYPIADTPFRKEDEHDA